MNGIIYARYSSDSQREESIEGQIRECKAFAEKNDIHIVDTYIDRALSAKTDNRPSFQQMIKDSSKKNFDVVVVWKLDRFARNRYDSAHYKTMLKKNGVKVISATEAISEGAEGILLETMLEGMAEYYSVELAEKVNRGLKENALKCKYNGGTLPIGYVVDSDKHYQLDPVTAPAVADAFKMYANGMGMQQIADELNIRGVRTQRNNGKLDVDNITCMLHNRKYTGEYRYKDVVIPGGIPAIVTEELFEKVQERMILNKKAPAKHKAEDEYLLTTKLYCAKCNCYMVGESGTSHTGYVHHYYKCVSAKNHKGCKKKTVKKDWIENLVLKEIQKVIFDDELLERLTDMALEKLGSENKVLPILQKRYSETERAINNMLNAIEQGIVTPSTKQRLEELEQQKGELSVQIMKEEMSKPVLTREQILFWFHRLRKLNIEKLEHRRKLFDTFINAIYLDDDKMVITFNFKDGSKTITFAEIEEAEKGSDFTDFGAPLELNPNLFVANLVFGLIVKNRQR